MSFEYGVEYGVDQSPSTEIGSDTQAQHNQCSVYSISGLSLSRGSHIIAHPEYYKNLTLLTALLYVSQSSVSFGILSPSHQLILIQG